MKETNKTFFEERYFFRRLFFKVVGFYSLEKKHLLEKIKKSHAIYLCAWEKKYDFVG